MNRKSTSITIIIQMFHIRKLRRWQEFYKPYYSCQCQCYISIDTWLIINSSVTERIFQRLKVSLSRKPIGKSNVELETECQQMLVYKLHSYLNLSWKLSWIILPLCLKYHQNAFKSLESKPEPIALYKDILSVFERYHIQWSSLQD